MSHSKDPIDRAREDGAAKLAEERKAKAEALKLTIGNCVVCTLPLAYVQDGIAKVEPFIQSHVHYYCAPIRELQKACEALSLRTRGTEQRLLELQRIAMDRERPIRERVLNALDRTRMRAAHAFHSLADRTYPRDKDEHR